MRIEFKKIEISNFMAFSDEVFEFDKHNGLNLVCGKNNDIPGAKNGCGKSILFSALCFSLFGQTTNNLKNTNIHNKYVQGKEVRVITYFDIEEHKYKVTSGFNKYGAPYCLLSDITNETEVDLTKSSIAETRKFLETELLHCDLSIFLRTILLSSDQNYNFFRLKKADKKEFIEKLFDISVFSQMYDVIHKDILNMDKDIIVKQNTLVMLNKQKDEYQQLKDDFLNNSKNKIEQLQSTLITLENKRKELQDSNISLNETEVKKQQQTLDKISEAINIIDTNICKLNKEHSDLQVAMHKLLSSKEQKQKIINKHSELMNKLCEDCKIIFSSYHNLDKYLSDIQKIEKEYSEKQLCLDECNKKTSILNEKLLDCDKKKEKVEKNIQLLTEQYNKTSREIYAIEAKLQSVDAELAKIKTDKNPYEDIISKNLEDIQKSTNVLEELSKKYKYLKFAENVVSQDTIRKFIISDLIGLLNNKIKMYLSKFGAKYNVIFDSDMNYQFITDGGTYEYDNFSAGERARLMIAACFAFRDFMYIRNNFSSNILILDEFIDGAIDSLAIDSILEILKEFSEIWKQNIFIVSHRKEVNNDIFDNIIQVVKTNNISKVTYLC